MDADAALARFASRREGVFVTGEARALGVTDRMLERRTSKGIVERIEPGVYRYAAAPRTWTQSVRVACAAERGWASHRTAAALWGLEGARPGIVEVVVPRWHRRPNRSVRVHETRMFDDTDQAEIDGIPVTSAPRTIADLGAVVPIDRVELALDDAWNRGLVSAASMWACIERLDVPGRPWIAPLRRLLAMRSEAVPEVQSNRFERMVLRLLVDAGLPEPESQVEIRRPDGSLIGRVDHLYRHAKVILECDGAGHGMGARRRADYRRDRELQALGYDVLRISWEDLTVLPDRLIADVRAALRLLA